MRPRVAILSCLVVGLAAGVVCGIVLSALFSRGLAIAYGFSAVAYGLAGGVTASGAGWLLLRFLDGGRVLRIVSTTWVALFTFFVLAYWGNKWLLAGVPFHSGRSIALDGGAVIASLFLGLTVSRLVPVSGRSIARPLTLAGLLLLVPTVLLLAGGSRVRTSTAVPDPTDRPSVLLISVDALRADHLGCYGYDRPTSPTIDRLAEGGVRFDRAFCPVPSSSPSHASMLTGLSPQSHGVLSNAFILADAHHTLAEYFADQGYATGGFVTNVLLGDRFGFAQGFHTYVESGHVEKLVLPGLGLLFQTLIVKEALDKLLYRYADGPDPTLLAAEKWLRQIGDRPFFLFFHLLDPHAPYAPLEPYRSMFPVDVDRVAGRDWTRSGKDPRKLAHFTSLYDGEVAAADAKLSELLALLEEGRRAGRLLVVLTSDHGENLGDHRPFFKHEDVYDSVLRVPLVFHFPGVLEGGRAVEGVVETTDIVPTILSLLDLPRAHELSGRDLLPLMKGEQGDPGRFVLSYHGKRFALRNRDWKLKLDLRSGEKFLFDLREDPNETKNVYSALPDQAQQLESLLLGEISRFEPDGLPAEEEAIRMEQMDRETKERLRGLGYLD